MLEATTNHSDILHTKDSQKITRVTDCGIPRNSCLTQGRSTVGKGKEKTLVSSSKVLTLVLVSYGLFYSKVDVACKKMLKFSHSSMYIYQVLLLYIGLELILSHEYHIKNIS